MRRQHFAVRINIDPHAVRLLEQLLQILQVMAGNEDGFALDRFDAHRRGHRMPVGAGVGGIEYLHGLKVDLAALEAHPQQLVHRRLFFRQVAQRFGKECINRLRLLSQDLRMIRVSGCALDSIDQQFLQSVDVRPMLVFAGQDRNHPAFRDQTGQSRRRNPRGGTGQGLRHLAGLAGGVFIKRFSRIPHPGGFAQRHSDGFRVKIDVGDGDEQRFENESVHGGIMDAEGAGPMSVLSNAFAGMDQEVLQDGAILVLAAYREVGAARTL